MTNKKNVETAVIYARVSTEKQDYSEQVVHLRGWGENRGYKMGEVYAETESAWKDGHQKELARLLADAHRGKFHIVLVWALDRVTRGGALAILQLIHGLKQYGVRVISYQEPWTDGPTEMIDVLYSLAGWVAQMESQRRSERTKLGIERKRRETGGRWGRRKGQKDKTPRKKRGPAQ